MTSQPPSPKQPGYAAALLEHPVRQWRTNQVAERTEHLIEETPVVLVYNQVPHVVMMATPQDLEDFALGFSLTEELIRSAADLESVDVVRYSKGIEIQATVPTACQAVIEGRTRRLTGRTGCGILPGSHGLRSRRLLEWVLRNPRHHFPVDIATGRREQPHHDADDPEGPRTRADRRGSRSSPKRWVRSTRRPAVTSILPANANPVSANPAATQGLASTGTAPSTPATELKEANLV